MLFRNLILICIVLCLILGQILAMSKKENILEFKDLYSYMQVSSENNHLVFRAIIIPMTLVILDEYKFYKEEGSGKYILSLFKKAGPPTFDMENSAGIKCMHWGEIRIRMKNIKLDLNKDEVFYRDSKGDHKIIFSTKESWINHLKEEYKKYPELLNKTILKDLDDL